GYSVTFKIDNKWDAGYTATVTITNTGEETIENWCMSFPLEQSISNIWNASIEEELDGFYVVKNLGWNQDIAVGASVSFGMTVYEAFTGFPEYYTMLGKEIELGGDDYTVEYVITEDWGTGYKAEISITNNKSEPLEDWRLSFDYADNTITQIWDAEIVLLVDGRYEISCPDYSQNIGANSSVSFGFMVEPGCSGNLIENIALFEFVSTACDDTDGDGLKDEDEINITFTDPELKDTDENGIFDGDEDFDKDGLINTEEIDYGTSPIVYDTDRDGLDDKTELEIGTNPLVSDSDGDGLLDGAEGKLGLDPFKPDTDDDGVLDCYEIIEQEYCFEIDNEEKKEVTSVSVELACAGLLDDYIYVEDMYGLDVYSSDVMGLVGVPVEVQLDTEFDEARITFSYDEDALGDISEENLRVMWYDVANGTYVMFDDESVVDTEANTVSYVTNHFSTYMLVDREVWIDACRQDVNYRESGEAVCYDIMFCVDVSGSMKGKRLTLAKTALNAYIDAMIDGDFAGLVSFADSGKLVNELTFDKELLRESVDSLKASGGTDANSGLWMAANQLIDTWYSNEKMIILICDGDVDLDDDLVTFALNEGITIHCINVASGTAKDMRELAYATGGSYYYAATSEDIIEKMEELQGDTVDYVDVTDSDGDGLYDVYEVNGMKLSNGLIVCTDPQKADSDGDGVSDYDELGMPVEQVVYFDGDVYTCTFYNAKSHPGKADSDGDSMNDGTDDSPYIKNFVEVAALSNDLFVPVSHDGSVWYGGNQSWWSGYEPIESYGCGIIAMCNTELYLTMNNPEFDLDYENVIELDSNGYCTYDFYKEFGYDRYRNKYHYSEYFTFPVSGALPWKMEAGLEDFYKCNGVDTEVTWAPTTIEKYVYGCIKNMLDSDIPVVVSYHTFDKDKALCYYTYNQSDVAMVDGNGSCTSHYFMVTGVVKMYEEQKYVIYLQLSTSGERKYAKYDEWSKKLDYFTNILYTTGK
ncbi:MAG: cellulose binding domain-containing protein, partial [Lachnospiraceae bacterium]|nr:cellulose binding domain-containing protein [Lachnospiraceae bacterium]